MKAGKAKPKSRKKEAERIYKGDYALSAKNDEEAFAKRGRADKQIPGVHLGFPRKARKQAVRITPKRPKLRR